MTKTQALAMGPASAMAFIALSGSVSAADSPGKLRAEMMRAEQDYITLYNKLNSERQFDIVCVTDRPTGSSIPVRTCQARYLLRAAVNAATERMQSAVAAGNSTGAANANGPNVGATTGGGAVAGQPDKLQAFRQNILEVQQKNPELQALGKRRDELQARYDEASKASRDSR
jgi:hypothetical protein